MTTLAEMKSTIADDLARSDLTTQIAAEISRAITYYQSHRFWFNEGRDKTFATVVNQWIYDAGDDADVPLMIEIDQAFLSDGSSEYDLTLTHWGNVESGNKNSNAARPTWLAMLNGTIGLSSIPDAIYTVRLVGHEKAAAPASDAETGNVWMVNAFDLIRSRACKQIEARIIRDREAALVSAELEKDALAELDRLSTSRMGTGQIVPTDF